MRKSHSNALVVLQPLVVGPDSAVHQSKDEALEGKHGVVHQDSLQRLVPLCLASGQLLKVRLLTGQAGNAKDQVKLCELVVVLDLFRIRNEFLVDTKESGLVENRK